MSFDVSLHRTFDYQLSPAALRIIDWAPIKPLAQSALQTSDSVSAYRLVEDATSNAGAVAAAYTRQEAEQRERASRAYAVSPAPADAAGGSATAVSGGAAAGAARVTASGGGGASHAETVAPSSADERPPPPPRQQSETWPPSPGDGGVSHSAAAGAAEPSSAAVQPAAGLPVGGQAATGNVSVHGTPRASTAAPAPTADAPPWLLAREVTQYALSGMMFGCDYAYQKDSFGVLVGLFSGGGYRQVNTYHRQEAQTPAVQRRHTEAAAAAAVALADGDGGGAFTTAPAATTAGPTTVGTGGPADAAPADPPATEATSALPAAPSASPSQRRGPVIASQRSGQLQFYDALQLFWYWGARRWTGVFNLRLTPPPCGDAVLPTCEYVARTPMTECSVLVDDPVVYLHGFVVMLGRRTRAAEEVGGGHERHSHAGVAATPTPTRSLPALSEQPRRDPRVSHTRAAASDGAGDGAALPAPVLERWHRHCLVETSDEWLWSRTAAMVAQDAARSTARWWKPQHIKMGAGLSYRYRKPRGVNVYWGWSAQLGRGTHVSGHIDVLRRMTCAVSSTFGVLDASVRLRVNLVTLHQTALDAGLCWRPLPQAQDFAVRVATSANGTTVGIELADVAPTLYDPVVRRLADWRARRHRGEPPDVSRTAHLDGDDGDDGRGTARATLSRAHRLPAARSSTAPPPTSDASREDLVGLLPITWHYLQGIGTTVTATVSNVAGVVTSALSTAASTHGGGGGGGADGHLPGHNSGGGGCDGAAAHGSAAERRRPPAPFSGPPPATPAAATSMAHMPADRRLSSLVLPARQATVNLARDAWHTVADLGWMERALRRSHLNISVGVSSDSSRRRRDWSFFLILTEK
ncbi:hypothetical protein NESM_000418200 [Novymonas esmeraldas]|uniref:Uncharacterized protein n=1 Tax=Novymonas esmeraldas TaxID=1808958 RepID=A0AAW0ELN2_9TRYP